jgi:hypothetical protein
MLRLIAIPAACLALGACAQTVLRDAPQRVAYYWRHEPPLPPEFTGRPPAEIAMRWQRGTFSPKAAHQAAIEQCMAFDRLPDLRVAHDAAQIRCDRPLISRTKRIASK